MEKDKPGTRMAGFGMGEWEGHFLAWFHIHMEPKQGGVYVMGITMGEYCLIGSHVDSRGGVS